MEQEKLVDKKGLTGFLLRSRCSSGEQWKTAKLLTKYAKPWRSGHRRALSQDSAQTPAARGPSLWLARTSGHQRRRPSSSAAREGTGRREQNRRYASPTMLGWLCQQTLEVSERELVGERGSVPDDGVTSLGTAAPHLCTNEADAERAAGQTGKSTPWSVSRLISS